MATITLKIAVSDITAVMSIFDQIKIYRSTTGIDGVYSEITDVSTRIALASTTTIYTYIDSSGDTDYYYKAAYFHSTTLEESGKSDAIQGEGDPALDIISVTELKTNYLFGLDLTNDSGEDYPDSLYEWFIKSAVSWLEHKLDLPIRPKSVTDERHPYIRDDYDHYLWVRAKYYPLIAVEEVRLVLPGEQEVQNFDVSWIYPENDTGVIQIVPGSGAAGTVLLGASGVWLPLIYRNNKYIPDVWRIKYTAGLESGEVPDVLKDAVGKVASFGPLNIAGDLLGGAGIASQSIGIDGLSTSFNTTSSSTSAGYGARLLQYQKEVKDVLPTLRRYFKGPGLTVV